MQRVVVLGRGAAGKSTFARRLAGATGLPLTELDTVFWSAVFWSADLRATPPDRWREVQARLVAADRWILDGDLGPYDQLDVRVAAADTVVVFDFGLLVCAARALRRSRERADFWLWLIRWRRRSLPGILATVAQHAPAARLVVLRSAGEAEAFLAGMA